MIYQDRPHIRQEIVDLQKMLDEVKRDNWDLSDDVIDAYLIGKDNGAKDFISSVVSFYVSKLNTIQLSVESIYSKLIKNKIDCQKALMKINGLDFSVIFIISNNDFHNHNKKKLCYSISQEELIKVSDKEYLLDYMFTCSENLDLNFLELSGYNVKFG
jgi:hypothetical protein